MKTKKIKIAISSLGTVDKCSHCGTEFTNGVCAWKIDNWESLELCNTCLKNFYKDICAYTFKEYMIRVREQLDCNASEEYKSQYIVYTYTNEQVNNNLDYFRKCKKQQLSAYKALLFFHDYLEGNYNI